MSDDLDQSKQARDDSRERLHLTLVEARDRFSPSSLGREALSKAKERAAETVETVTEKAKERPALTAAIATGIVAIFLRKPIFGVIKHLIKEKKNG